MVSGLDVSLFRRINDAHSPLGDLVFGQISALGDGLVVALVCALLMLVHARAGGTALAAFVVSGLIAQAIKHAFDVPRPPAVLEHVHVLGSALHAHSFPSGHATSDGVMVAAALLWRRDGMGWAIAALFLLAAIGRVYGGVHFPSDVAAGLVLGAATMLLCWRVLGRLPWRQWENARGFPRAVGLLVALLAAVLGLGYPVQPATGRPLAVVLAVGALVFLAWRLKRTLRTEARHGG